MSLNVSISVCLASSCSCNSTVALERDRKLPIRPPLFTCMRSSWQANQKEDQRQRRWTEHMDTTGTPQTDFTVISYRPCAQRAASSSDSGAKVKWRSTTYKTCLTQHITCNQIEKMSSHLQRKQYIQWLTRAYWRHQHLEALNLCVQPHSIWGVFFSWSIKRFLRWRLTDHFINTGFKVSVMHSWQKSGRNHSADQPIQQIVDILGSMEHGSGYNLSDLGPTQWTFHDDVMTCRCFLH